MRLPSFAFARAYHCAAAEVPIVFVIDDDESMRRGLTNLFESVGLRVEAFGSAPELLQKKLPDGSSCVVLDIRLPGMGGLDFQDLLEKASIHIPIVFMTGHGDIPKSVKAMKAGAADFLTKPFRQQEMLDAVTVAIERDRTRRQNEKIISNRAHFETLTPQGAGYFGLGLGRTDEQTDSSRAWHRPN
jgi:FixJ family two-component response regulator